MKKLNEGQKRRFRIELRKETLKRLNGVDLQMVLGGTAGTDITEDCPTDLVVP